MAPDSSTGLLPFHPTPGSTVGKGEGPSGGPKVYLQSALGSGRAQAENTDPGALAGGSMFSSEGS